MKDEKMEFTIWVLQTIVYEWANLEIDIQTVTNNGNITTPLTWI